MINPQGKHHIFGLSTKYVAKRRYGELHRWDENKERKFMYIINLRMGETTKPPRRDGLRTLVHSSNLESGTPASVLPKNGTIDKLHILPLYEVHLTFPLTAQRCPVQFQNILYLYKIGPSCTNLIPTNSSRIMYIILSTQSEQHHPESIPSFASEETLSDI